MKPGIACGESIFGDTMNAQYPCLTADGLLFQLSCGGELLSFLIGPDELALLALRYGYTMDAMNLYRAHEAVIHLTARIAALEKKSTSPVVLESRHFLAYDAIRQAALQPAWSLDSLTV